MAVLCPDYNLLFIGNIRTGSTAISKTLLAKCDGVFIPEKRCVLNGERVSKKHSTLRQLIAHDLLEQSPDTLFKFVAVRNPYDSIVSKYLKRRHREKFSRSSIQTKDVSFRDFVMRNFRDSEPQSMHAAFVDGADEVIRFEELQEGLSRVLDRAKAPEFELPVINRTEHKDHYSDYYDDETREVVGRVYAEDLERFGYAFDETR